MARSASTGKLAERLVHKRNRFVALVRRQPGISRQDCAHALRMSTFTASRLAGELIRQRIIVEGEEPADVPRPVGRPSRPLHVRGDYGLFAGVEMEASEWRFVIVDFAGQVVHSVGVPFLPCDSREGYLEQLERLLREQISAQSKLWGKVLALGLGAPGVLDYASGVVVDYNLLPEFKNVPLLDLCRDIGGKPVYLMDNIRALAMRHLLMHPESDGRTIVHVAVRSGIACALCQNGRIFEGCHRQAGELGAFPVYSPRGDGKMDRFEGISGLSGLRRSLPDLPAPFWKGDAQAIEQAWAHSETQPVLAKAMALLGHMLASVAMLMDPDEIFVHGPLFQAVTPLWTHVAAAYDAAIADLHGNYCRPMRAGQSDFEAAVGVALYGLECTYPRGA